MSMTSWLHCSFTPSAWRLSWRPPPSPSWIGSLTIRLVRLRALLQMDQQVGGALGIAVIAAVYALGSRPDQFIAGLANAYFTAAVIAVFAALVAWRGIPGSPARTVAA